MPICWSETLSKIRGEWIWKQVFQSEKFLIGKVKWDTDIDLMYSNSSPSWFQFWRFLEQESNCHVSNLECFYTKRVHFLEYIVLNTRFYFYQRSAIFCSYSFASIFLHCWYIYTPLPFSLYIHWSIIFVLLPVNLYSKYVPPTWIEFESKTESASYYMIISIFQVFFVAHQTYKPPYTLKLCSKHTFKV